MFTHDAPPKTAVLNSLADDLSTGDERNFLSLRDTGNGSWSADRVLTASAGGRYEAQINFHNDAASPGQVSRGTRVSAQLPATVSGRERITAMVTSGNAEPPAVWRSLVVANSAGSPVAIRIVPGTARLYTGRAPAGVPVSADELFSQRGVLVGCAGPTGDVSGEDDCRGYVRFEFVADQPNFTITQQAAKSGTKQWEYSPQVGVEDRVDFKIQYQNTGTTRQNDVVIKYEMPEHLSFVRGTTMLSASSTKSAWTPVNDDGIIGRGINIGSYLPTGNAYVRLTAQVSDVEGLRCGSNQLSGRVTAETNNGSKSQQLTVEVDKKC
jgi:hypothetical protein